MYSLSATNIDRKEGIYIGDIKASNINSLFDIKSGDSYASLNNTSGQFYFVSAKIEEPLKKKSLLKPEQVEKPLNLSVSKLRKNLQATSHVQHKERTGRYQGVSTLKNASLLRSVEPLNKQHSSQLSNNSMQESGTKRNSHAHNPSYQPSRFKDHRLDIANVYKRSARGCLNRNNRCDGEIKF